MRLATIILPLFAIPVVLAGPIYTVANLGGFGGGAALGYKINNSGEAVGWAQTASGDTHPFRVFAGSTLEDLADPSASDSFAYGVNGAGQIAGTSYINGQPHGFVMGTSGMGPYGTGDLGSGTYALGINASGQVSGGNGHAFLYANGSTQDLGTLAGGTWSAGYGINDSGAVAGTGDIGNGMFRGFLWTAASGMTAFGTLGGANSHATAINNGGEVVGFATLASGYEHAFAYVGGQLIDLGTLGGGSFAYDVNDSGAVVGYSWLAGGANPHAFVDLNGVMLDLNSLIPANSGWELQQAYGISASGQIVGTGLFQGQNQAFRLDPLRISTLALVRISAVPEPASSVLILIGIALILAARIRAARSL